MSERIAALVGFALLVGLAGPARGQPGDGKKDGGAGKPPGPTLKEVYKKHFLIGMAGDLPGNYSEAELALAKGHFNVVTPENCMKPGPVHPHRGHLAVRAARRPGEVVRREQASPSSATPWSGTPRRTPGSSPAATRRPSPSGMKAHIRTLVGRYKGKVRGWDVVNEAINDRGDAETAKTENLRNSQWLRTVGPEFLTLAFKFAREADPDAKLYYNDYGIEAGPKHDSSMVLLRRLIKDGAPVHGVGIQGHWRTDTVPYEAIDKAIEDYASLGLKVSITELDVTIRGAAGGQFGPGRRPRGEVKPPSAEDLKAQADAYAKLFAIFIKHKDVIERVTFWGLSDRRTWRFGQHPLLFDADNRPKPAYAAVVDALLRPNPDLGPPR